MGMAVGGGGRGGRGRRGRARRGALSEINVTPLVDVMLVLLIIFMISAPLLTAGVEVTLPKAEARSLQDQSEPLTVTVRRDGEIFVGEDPATYEQLGPRLDALADGDKERPIYVRADGRAEYEKVAQVMAKLSGSGFTRINLVTEAVGEAGVTASREPPAE